jgi:hypothetical protein
MAPALLDPEESQVESLEVRATDEPAKQLVQEGQLWSAVPNPAFADVGLDTCFTGSASYGAKEPSFSQFENLDTRGLWLGEFAPEPVRKHTVYVIVARFDAREPFIIGGNVYAGDDGTAVIVAGHSQALVTTALQRDRAPVLSLASVTQQMRGLVDLPVQDVAKMCGLGRRQFYNLMRGESEATKTRQAEQHIRQMFAYLTELNVRLDGDVSQVRSALLLPLDDSSRESFYDVALRGDASEIAARYENLQEKLDGTGRLPKTLPPSGTKLSRANWQKAADFMHADQRGH